MGPQTEVCLNVYLKKEKGKIIIVERKQWVRFFSRIQHRETALVEQSVDVATKKAMAPLFLRRNGFSFTIWLGGGTCSELKH